MSPALERPPLGKDTPRYAALPSGSPRPLLCPEWSPHLVTPSYLPSFCPGSLSAGPSGCPAVSPALEPAQCVEGPGPHLTRATWLAWVAGRAEHSGVSGHSTVTAPATLSVTPGCAPESAGIVLTVGVGQSGRNSPQCWSCPQCSAEPFSWTRGALGSWLPSWPRSSFYVKFSRSAEVRVGGTGGAPTGGAWTVRPARPGTWAPLPTQPRLPEPVWKPAPGHLLPRCPGGSAGSSVPSRGRALGR